MPEQHANLRCNHFIFETVVIVTVLVYTEINRVLNYHFRNKLIRDFSLIRFVNWNFSLALHGIFETDEYKQLVQTCTVEINIENVRHADFLLNAEQNVHLVMYLYYRNVHYKRLLLGNWSEIESNAHPVCLRIRPIESAYWHWQNTFQSMEMHTIFEQSTELSHLFSSISTQLIKHQSNQNQNRYQNANGLNERRILYRKQNETYHHIVDRRV